MTKGLDEILSGDEPVQEVTTPEPTTEAPEPAKEPQPRGEHGHFAPKEPKEPVVEPTEEPASPAPDKPAAATPPPPGVIEERNRRKEAEARAAELERQLAALSQPKPAAPAEPAKPVDIWENPDGFVKAALDPIQQELAQTRFDLSLDRAIATHGEDAVKAAETALREAVERGELDGNKVRAALSQSRAPILDIVQWHQNSPAVREAKLREQIRAELQQEMAASQPQPTVEQPSTPAPVMPTNLVGQRNVAPRSGPAWSGPRTLNDIFDRNRK